MTPPNDRCSDALRRARAALERANRAAGLAERHEQLAAPDRAERTRALHNGLAAKYRDVEMLHRASATLQAAFAERLVRRSAAPSSWAGIRPTAQATPPIRPRFIAMVAEASGGERAALALRVHEQVDAVTTTSDQTASAAQNLESELCEGPGRDAIRSRELVSAAGEAIARHWPAYGHDVAELGIRAVVAAPLVAAGECLGALTVFGEPQICASVGVHRLRTVAAAVTQAVLLASGSTAAGEEDLPYFPALEDGEGWPVVHQAAGMLAARNGCGIADAFALLRAHAFAEGAGIASVAARIVRRELDLPVD